MKLNSQRLTAALGMDEQRRIRAFWIYLIIFIIGCVIGAATAGSLAETEKLQNICSGIIELYSQPEFGRLILRSFAINSAFLVVCFICGLFAFGMIVSGAALFIKGLCAGVAAGALCSVLQLGGLTFYVLAFLPGTVFGTVASVYISAIGYETSRLYLSSLAGNGKRRTGFKRTYISYIVAITLVAAASLTDAVLGCVFGGLL